MGGYDSRNRDRRIGILFVNGPQVLADSGISLRHLDGDACQFHREVVALLRRVREQGWQLGFGHLGLLVGVGPRSKARPR